MVAHATRRYVKCSTRDETLRTDGAKRAGIHFHDPLCIECVARVLFHPNSNTVSEPMRGWSSVCDETNRKDDNYFFRFSGMDKSASGPHFSLLSASASNVATHCSL